MRSLFQSHPTIDEETLYRRVLEIFDLKRLTSNVRNTLAPLASEEGLEFTEPNSLETDSEIAETASSSGKKYDFEIFGEPCSVDTLADVLVSVLLFIHKIDDNFLPRISRGSGRARPILARDPQELYPGRHYLCGGPGSLDSLAAWLRCTPAADHAARILLLVHPFCCCCACGYVVKARRGLSIISTGRSSR